MKIEAIQPGTIPKKEKGTPDKKGGDTALGGR